MFKRGRIWWISVGGVRQSAGTSIREDAKALEHKLNREAWGRKNGLVIPTWEQACNSWIDNNPKQAEAYHNLHHCEWWKLKLKGRRLSDIEPKDVHKIITENFKVGLQSAVPANATANGYVSFVGKIIRHGSNLRPSLIYYPKSAGRDRWLTPDEWHTFKVKMPPDLQDISTFALVTGLREANDMFFKWAWLHDKDTWALLPKELTKTKKPYGIPLNKTAQAVIKRRREASVRHPELVFINNGKPWYRAALCDDIRETYPLAEIPRITFHGFRHTFASWLAQKGVSDTIRDRLGCWQSGSQGSHYSHFDVEGLRPFSELIDVILATSGSQSKATA